MSRYNYASGLALEQRTGLRYPKGRSRTCYQECGCHLKFTKFKMCKIKNIAFGRNCQLNINTHQIFSVYSTTVQFPTLGNTLVVETYAWQLSHCAILVHGCYMHKAFRHALMKCNTGNALQEKYCTLCLLENTLGRNTKYY